MIFILGCACLAVIAGIFIGRMSSAGVQLGRKGMPAALLLIIISYFLDRGGALSPFYLLGFSMGGSALMMAVPVGVIAVFSVFVPNKTCLGLGTVIGVLGWISFVFAIQRQNMFGNPFPDGVILGVIGCGLTLVCSCAGLAAKRQKSYNRQTVPEDLSGEESGANKDEVPESTEIPKDSQTGTWAGQESKTVSGGKLTILAPPFSGQVVPALPGEGLRIGSDAAVCDLILDIPGMPPCLCEICWLEAKNTYLVTSCCHHLLSLGDGRLLPENSVIEIFPENILYLAAIKQPVIKVG